MKLSRLVLGTTTNLSIAFPSSLLMIFQSTMYSGGTGGSDSGDVVSITEDVESSFYVHPSKNHGALICAITFTGNNYTSWKIAIKRSLSAKKKLRLVTDQLRFLMPLLLRCCIADMFV